jgi:hypothetical protein
VGHRIRWLAIAAALALLACNPVAEKAAAQALADQAFAARQGGQAEQAVLLYRDGPDGQTPRRQWTELLAALEGKLGRPTAYELTSWNVNVGTSEAGTGTTVRLVYAVRYERAEGTESLVLFKPSGSAEYQVVGHHVSSPALLFDSPQPLPPGPEAPTRDL